jgi:antitoxin CptB
LIASKALIIFHEERMTGLSRSTDGLNPRQKRILFRAWHRGTREMDLVMGRYVESVIETMSESELVEIETLIDLADRDLFAWISDNEPAPAVHDGAVLRAMRAFHSLPRAI